MAHGEEPEFIDHINGNPADNRLCNLRSVSAAANQQNSSMQSNNTSGSVGVYKLRSGGWQKSETIILVLPTETGRLPAERTQSKSVAITPITGGVRCEPATKRSLTREKSGAERTLVQERPGRQKTGITGLFLRPRR